MRTKSLLCGCIVLLVMVVTTATPCFADNVIYGCVKNSGELLIVSGPGQCKSSQTPISWNRAGVANGITRAIHGFVDEDGTIIAGDNFTVVKDFNIYKITFQPNFFLSRPTCTTQGASNQYLLRIHPDTTDGIWVEAYWATLVPNDGNAFQSIEFLATSDYT